MHAGCVFPQPRLVCIRLTAVFTNMRTIACVRPQVDQIRAAEAERSATCLTAEWPLIRMQARMLNQLNALSESLSTHADKWPLTAMRSQMGSQVAVRRELLAAHLARVPPAVGGRSVVLVHVAEMQAQLSAGVEALRTRAACVRARGDVNGEMVVEVGATDERATTQLTHERLLFTMQWQVAAQVAGERESPATMITFMRFLSTVRTFMVHQSLLLGEASTTRRADKHPHGLTQQTLVARSTHGGCFV